MDDLPLRCTEHIIAQARRHARDNGADEPSLEGLSSRCRHEGKGEAPDKPAKVSTTRGQHGTQGLSGTGVPGFLSSAAVTMRIAVMGMGNSLMTDDAVGLRVIDALEGGDLAGRLPTGVEVGFLRNEAGGWEILDDVEGYDVLVLVDACITPSLENGQCAWFSPGQFTSPRMSGTHTMDVFAAIEFGRRSGLHVPGRVVALGIGVRDIHTFSEELTPTVAAAVPVAADLVFRKALEIAAES